MESVDEIILNEIRVNYPFLYNIRDRRYRNREERDRAWEDISSIVDLDAKSCKTRWRSIRDRYLKERRRSPSSPERKRWRLMPKLTFLDDTLEAKAPRTPSISKRKILLADQSTPSTTTHRLLLPAVALPSAVRPSSSSSANVFPISILKTSPKSSPQGEPRQPPPLKPHPPALQPAISSSSTSLFLLPATSTRSPASTTTTASTTTLAISADPRRKQTDQLSKVPVNPNQNLDEEDYYGLSVAGRLKKLSQRDRALVRIEIEKIFLKHET